MSELSADQIDNRDLLAAGKRYSLLSFLWRGSLGFCLVSLLVFATVAFAERWMYQTLGVAGAYTVWTLLFMLLGASVFLPLIINKARRLQFYFLFSLAFLCYAIGWIAAWFLVRGKLGEWLGSLGGSILMAMAFAAGFRAWRILLKLIIVLFVTNSIGYFIGDALNNLLSGKLGMLTWGAVYGFGLGAGLAAVLYFVQADSREP